MEYPLGPKCLMHSLSHHLFYNPEVRIFIPPLQGSKLRLMTDK